MGLFGFGRASSTQAAEALAPGRRVRLSSPWSPGLSASIIAADWMGANQDLFPVTREMAMKVPAVAAARNLICTTLAQATLQQWTKDALASRQPAWMSRTDSEVPPQIRTLWTFDDLLFSGFSLWQAFRASSGQIGDAVRVPFEAWDWDEDMNVLIDDEPVNARDVILFTGWDEGLLLTANDAIKQSLAISRAVATRVNTPVPHTLLEENDANMRREEDEIKTLVSDFAQARSRQNGAVSYVPGGIKVREYGMGDIGLYEQGRNAAALEIARHTGIPASLLEASGVAASLTYETAEANRVILNDRLRSRANVFEARLSMDDVVPRGSRTVLDLSFLTGPDTGRPPAAED